MSGGREDVVVPIYDPDSRRLLHDVTLQPGADLADYVHALPDGRTGALYAASTLDAQTLFNKRDFGITFCVSEEHARPDLTASAKRALVIDAIRRHSPVVVHKAHDAQIQLDRGSQGLVDRAAIAEKLRHYTFYLDKSTGRLKALDHRAFIAPKRFDPTMHDQLFFHGRSHGDDHRFREPFDIVVKTLTDKRITCRVSPAFTIFQLKEMIHDQEGIPPEQQRIIFDGRQMEDAKTVGFYRIGENAVLHLVLRLRGGMHHVSSARIDYDDMYLEARGTRVEWDTVDVAVRTCDGREAVVSISQRLDADDLKRQVVNLNRLCDGVATGGRTLRSTRPSSQSGGRSPRSMRTSSQYGGWDVAPQRHSGWRHP